MPNRPNRESIDHIPADHHHGGLELPDELQDRPEQNDVYDAVVRGERVDVDGDLDLTDLDDLLEKDGVLDADEPFEDEDLPH